MIHILIMDAAADDRAEVHKWLSLETDFVVAGSVSHFQAALSDAQNVQVDIILAGETLDEMSGLEAIRLFTSTYPGCGGILLARRDTTELRQQAAQAGVGFVFRSPDPHALFATIRNVHSALLSLTGGAVEAKQSQHQMSEPPPPVKPVDAPETALPEPGASSGVTPFDIGSSPGIDIDDERTQELRAVPTRPASPMKRNTGGEIIDLIDDSGEFEDAFGEFEDEDEEADIVLRREASKSPVNTARFSAYYPPHARPEQRYGLYMYAHTADALNDVQRDVQKFAADLGGVVPAPRTSPRTADLSTGTALTVVPECDGLEFEPASLTKKWRSDWTRFEFEFHPPAKAAGDVLMVRLSVQVSGIEIAHINCPIDITTADAPMHSPPTGDMLQMPDNPLAAARLKAASASMYSKIFISYSRKDMEVVRAYRLAQMAAGHEVFMDTENIHAGENWQAALAKAIDEADIFQLFWSEHSAASPNVRDEWDYCLRYKCSDNNCAGFIRPVYWQKPLPAPPNQLSHLNFRYVPLNADEDDA